MTSQFFDYSAGNSPVLSQIATGYAQASSILNFVVPTVPVNSATYKYIRFGKSHFAATSTKRVSYADHKQLLVDGYDTVSLALEMHSKEAVYDAREAREALRGGCNGDAVVDLEKFALERAVAAIELSLEIELHNLIVTPTNYEASNVVSVALPNRLTTAGSDPEALFRNLKSLLSNQIGQYPTRMVVSEDVYTALTLQETFRDRVKYTSAESNTLDMVAAWLGLPGGITVSLTKEYNPTTGLFQNIMPSGTAVMFYDVRDGSGFLGGSNDASATNVFRPQGLNGGLPNFGYHFLYGNGLQVSDFEYNRRNDTFSAIVAVENQIALTSVGDNNRSNAGILITNLI